MSSSSRGGALVHRALLAASQAERDGLSVAVVDLRTIIPYDWRQSLNTRARPVGSWSHTKISSLRIRRRDCRPYCAKLFSTRRAGYARGRARLSGCLCAVLEESFCRIPRTSSMRFADLLPTDN